MDRISNEGQEADESGDLCPAWGDCKLQNLAYEYQVTATRFDAGSDDRSQELANPLIVRDFSRCILCGRCVQACPVGALVEQKARHTWRPWKVEKLRSTCPYCGVGCQQWLHIQDGRIVKVTGSVKLSPKTAPTP